MQNRPLLLVCQIVLLRMSERENVIELLSVTMLIEETKHGSKEPFSNLTALKQLYLNFDNFLNMLNHVVGETII